MKKLFSSAIVVFSFALIPLSLRAAQQFWDPNGATVGTSVSGNWDTTSDNWTATIDSGVNAKWVQGNDANFALGGTYTVTLTEPITLGSLTATGTAGGLTIAGTSPNILTLATSSIFNITNASRTVTVSAPIAGAFDVTKSGNGILTLSGANTYSGDTTLSAGSIGIGVNSISSGGIITSGPLGTGNFVFSAAATVFASGAARVVHNPVILNGGLTDNGSQHLTFTNGDFKINGGQRNITVSGAGDLIIGSNLIDDGVARILLKIGTGRMVLAGNNASYLGELRINAGTVLLGSAAALPPNNIVNVHTNSTLDLGGYDAVVARLGGAGGSGRVLLGSKTLTAGSTSSSEFTGVISGTGGYVKVGTTSQVLSGTNTFTGGITINESVIYFPTNILTGSPYALGPGPNTITINGTGRIGANRNSPSISIVTNSVILSAGATAGLDPANGGHFILAGQASGPGGFLRYNQGGGFPILAGDNTFTGGVQMDARVLGLGHKNALGSGALSIGNQITPPATLLELASIADLTGANAIANPVIINQDFIFNTTRTNYNSPATFALELSGPVTLTNGIRTIGVIGTNIAKLSGIILSSTLGS